MRVFCRGCLHHYYEELQWTLCPHAPRPIAARPIAPIASPPRSPNLFAKVRAYLEEMEGRN